MKKLLFAAPVLFAAAAFKLADTGSAPEAPAVAPLTQQKAQGTATVADVVNAANAFMATLSTAQQATLMQTFNSTNVAKWSNLPVNANNRIGLRLDALTAAQRTAAMAVVQAATGTASNDGFDEIQGIRAADDNLTANGGGSGYGANVYLIAFLGTPSTTGTWMLQFGGHHLATNITFGNGSVTGATPKFEGIEPLSFTTANANIFPTGTTIAPMSNEGAAMLAMFNGLTATQKTTARLSTSFGDVVLGPGQDGNFPATKVGLPCSQLTAAQQQLVTAAMAPWVQDSDDVTAAALLAYYQTQLSNTYIAYSGTGNFTTNGDYARIDGPNVWIEFVCQSGVIYRSQIHYHSIWRDRARDYGGNFFTTVTGTKSVTAAQKFSVYPNPAEAGGSLHVQLTNPASTATYTLRNTLGQTLTTAAFRGSAVDVPTTGLAAGTYVLSLEADGQAAVTQRFVVR